MRQRIRALTIVALLLSASRLSAATLLDPRLHFRTITTEHFSIHFHQGEDVAAQRLAVIAEDVWTKVGKALNVQAPRRTHVILADQSELANGWATPLPYNTVFITAAAPSGSDAIGRSDDWLRLVFTHEFTHIVHLDRSEGWARFFRGLFGRTPIAFPNLWLPQWMVEGLAAYEESAITGSGRLYAGDFRAIEREAAIEKRTEPIDRVNGGLTDWPAGSAGYAFGLGFHDFLAQRYGSDRFGELAEVTAGEPPFVGAMAFDRVFGRSAESLWRDYRQTLERAAEASPHGAASAVTRLTHDGFVALGPRFRAPACPGCPPRLIYSARDPHGFPALRETDLRGSAPRRLASRYLGSTSGIAGTRVVFDQQEFRRNVGLYSDLYALDTTTGRVSPLTRNARLQDPDVSSDGRSLVAVRQDGDRRDLVVATLAGDRVTDLRVLLSAAGTTFNTPRWAPDGHSIAVARQSPGRLSEVIAVDARTGTVRTVAGFTSARVVTPTWTPDGRAIVAAADLNGDTFNLYEFRIASGGSVRRLSSTTGGATWPEISPDGRTIVFVGYTADGSDLFSMPFPSESDPTTMPPPVAVIPAEVTAPGAAPVSPYSPWRTLAPVTWMPLIQHDEQLRIGAAVSGGDVLAHHAWAASATWLAAVPEAAITPDARVPDVGLSYLYDRWRPSIFFSATSETDFLAGDETQGHAPEITVRAQQVEAGVYMPFRHARVTHRAIASVVARAERATPTGEIRDQDRVSLRFGGSTSSAHTFGYSISPERGITAGTTIELFRKSLGSTDDATVLTGDARAYLPGLAAHHVVAVRAAGGADLRGNGAGRVFQLGGADSRLDVIDFGRGAIGLLRGFPAGAASGSHIATFNADYRFPLARPQRGVGVWPMFLHTIHGAAFADVGSAWTRTWRRDAVKTSLGGELSFDVVAGFSFPATIAVGAAWGHDRRDRSDRGTYYVRIGHAF